MSFCDGLVTPELWQPLRLRVTCFPACLFSIKSKHLDSVQIQTPNPQFMASRAGQTDGADLLMHWKHAISTQASSTGALLSLSEPGRSLLYFSEDSLDPDLCGIKTNRVNIFLAASIPGLNISKHVKLTFLRRSGQGSCGLRLPENPGDLAWEGPRPRARASGPQLGGRAAGPGAARAAGGHRLRTPCSRRAQAEGSLHRRAGQCQALPWDTCVSFH